MDQDRQVCKACGRPDKFDFAVPDDLWKSVVPLPLTALAVCLYCFDRFAHEKNIDYARHIDKLYFAGDQASFVFVAESKIDRSNYD